MARQRLGCGRGACLGDPKIAEERERRLGKERKEKEKKKKEAVKRCKRREVDCFSALVARIFKTGQQTCATVAVVHGNALELILLGGPIRWKRRLHEGKSEGDASPGKHLGGITAVEEP